MKYMGSKNKLAKELVPIIQSFLQPNQAYIEPFVGGANIIDKIQGNRIGSDIHKELIAMWNAIQAGWEYPDTITEADYTNIRYGDYPDHLKGYVGFNASYSGKWWGGYARYVSPLGKKQEFDKEAHRFITRQLEGIKDITFLNLSYLELEPHIPKNSLIYCDPPYRGTTKYSNKFFDPVIFDSWCQDMKEKGHILLVSEYNIPKYTELLFSKNRRSSLEVGSAYGAKHKVENLYLI